MALSPDEIRQQYPLPVYNYRVTIGSEVASFSEVSGLSMKYETVSYRHGLSFIEGETLLRFVYEEAVAITMKKGVVKDHAFLYAWFSEKKPKNNIQVSLCDENGQALVQWKIGSALPVKLDAPTFDANANDVAIDTLEIMASIITVEIV